MRESDIKLIVKFVELLQKLTEAEQQYLYYMILGASLVSSKEG